MRRYFLFEIQDDIDCMASLVFSVAFYRKGWLTLAEKSLNAFSFDQEEQKAYKDYIILSNSNRINGTLAKAKCSISHNELGKAAVYLALIDENEYDSELHYLVEIYDQFADFITELRNTTLHFLYVYDRDNYSEEFEQALLQLDNELKTVDVGKEEFPTVDDGVKLMFVQERLVTKLMQEKSFYQSVESYFNHFEKNGKKKDMICLLYGSYKSLMEKKYDYPFILADEEFDFSIVIPARNDGYYLEYAIVSCLQQDYNGTYEILISDNSTIGNNCVKECVNRFDDKSIRYIKPKRELPLSKSFEFAYMNAKGKYMLSIGSDDALLPNCLSNLSKVIKEKKDVEVINWPGARFEWNAKPGTLEWFTTVEHEENSKYIETDVVMEKLERGDIDFMNIPTLYLRTCFSKSTIRKFVLYTGKFEDGFSQDIYTGGVVLNLYDKYYRINVPLSISGVSANSTGLNDRKEIADVEMHVNRVKEKNKRFRFDNFRIESTSEVNDFIFGLGFDIFEYVEVVRAKMHCGNDSFSITDSLFTSRVKKSFDCANANKTYKSDDICYRRIRKLASTIGISSDYSMNYKDQRRIFLPNVIRPMCITLFPRLYNLIASFFVRKKSARWRVLGPYTIEFCGRRSNDTILDAIESVMKKQLKANL
jgi:glycosyltransferase involved in cell wall biosynthesis